MSRGPNNEQDKVTIAQSPEIKRRNAKQKPTPATGRPPKNLEKGKIRK
jgi:hypothetical protein